MAQSLTLSTHQFIGSLKQLPYIQYYKFIFKNCCSTAANQIVNVQLTALFLITVTHTLHSSS